MAAPTSKSGNGKPINATRSTLLANSHGEGYPFSYSSVGLTLFEAPTFLLAAARLATAVQNTAALAGGMTLQTAFPNEWVITGN